MKEAIEALKAGNRERAFYLLRRHLAVNPEDATAWLWMSEAVTKPEQKVDALKRVLKLRPNHPRANLIRQRLRKLNALTQPQPIINPDQEADRQAQAEMEELPPSFHVESSQQHSSPVEKPELLEKPETKARTETDNEDASSGRRINLDALREEHSETVVEKERDEESGLRSRLRSSAPSSTPTFPEESPPPAPAEPEELEVFSPAAPAEEPVEPDLQERVELRPDPARVDESSTGSAGSVEPSALPDSAIAPPHEAVGRTEAGAETKPDSTLEARPADEVPGWIWIIMLLSLLLVGVFIAALLMMSNFI